MKEFHTRQIANEGVKLPLDYPDGTPSEYYLLVRSIDSDQFRVAETRAKRKAADIASIEDPDARAKAIRDAEIECIAALVAGWNFPDEYNNDNVVNFLIEAPQIADAVNRYAVDRRSIYAKKSGTSSTGAKPKSNSRSRRKVQK